MVHPEDNESEIRLQDIPIRWAKVTVSDGEREEILVGRMDEDIFPPYKYTGTAIKGEAGKKYSIKVEYSGRTVTAETTIPHAVKIDDFKVLKSEDCDTLYRIDVSFRDDKSEKNWYKLLTSISEKETGTYDGRYYSAFMGTVSDEILDSEESTITVNRPFRHIRTEDYSPYFHKGETVSVMLAQIDETSFNFWSDYENEISNGKNILFPSSSNLRSNVSGGRGIWCAYTGSQSASSDRNEYIVQRRLYLLCHLVSYGALPFYYLLVVERRDECLAAPLRVFDGCRVCGVECISGKHYVHIFFPEHLH